MRMRAALRSISTAGVLALLWAVAAFCQENSATTIRSTTRLVQLNVVVVDKQGQPVSGLSQEDFHVFDNGHEQKLIHWSVSERPSLAAEGSESPLTISNEKPRESVSPAPMTVILVDELVDQDANPAALRDAVRQARLQVLQFLKTLQPGEQVAIYAQRAEGVVVVHDFSDDREALITAAKTIGAGLLRSSLYAAPASPGAAAGGTSSNQTMIESAHQDMVSAGLQSITDKLHSYPGRKNLIWISGTFMKMVAGFDVGLMLGERDAGVPVAGAHSALPIPQYAWPENYIDRVRKFARSLSNANVAVYPMDPRGILGPQALSGAGADQPSSESSSGASAPEAPSVRPLLAQWAAMDLIASETGGRAFYNQNGIEHELRTVMDENHVAYILGYYPGDRAWDGKYHKIQVKVDRPGAVVRCRKGYFARDDTPPAGPEPALRRAAKSLAESSGIDVTLSVATNPLRWFNQDVVLKVRAQGIHFEVADQRYDGHLEVAFVQIGSNGLVVDGVKDDVSLSLLQESYDQALDLGWFYPRNLSINPTAEKLRVVVRDVATGEMGSVSVPVHDKIGK